MPVCVLVSIGAIVLAIRALSAGRFIWGLVFLGVLGAFTPFCNNHFSNIFVSIFDLAALALFAGSPFILAKARTSVISIASEGMLR